MPIRRPHPGCLTTPLVSSFFADFSLTENPISQGGKFRTGGVTGFYKDPRSIGGKCYAASTVGADYDDCLGQLQNHGIGANQRASLTVFRQGGYTSGDTHEFALYLRLVIGASLVRGYECLMNEQDGFQIVRWEGISQGSDNFNTGISVSGSGPGHLVTGDVIVFEGIGSNFRVLKNAVEVASFTDSTWTTGNPGLGFFVRPTGNTPENFCISAWSAQAA